jgi:RHS repeat-associated protein
MDTHVPARRRMSRFRHAPRQSRSARQLLAATLALTVLAVVGISGASAAEPVASPKPPANAPAQVPHKQVAATPGPLPTGDSVGAAGAPQQPTLALSPGSSASGPFNACCIDDFNRPDEDPLSQGGAWSPSDPRGSSFHDLLEVSSQRAANLDTGEGAGTLSYRVQDFPNPFELYATVAVRPSDNHGVHVNFNLRQLGSSSWDGYYLTWTARSGTDELRLIWCQDNSTCSQIGTAFVEMAAGDKFMVREIGSHIEGWVYQGGAWSKKIDVDDSTFTGSKIGAGIGGINPAGSNPARLDDYGGGPIPAPPGTQSIGTCDGSGTHAQSASACAAEPVNTLTGAYTTQVTDLQLPGIGVPFAWTRSYTSSDTTSGRLGPGWTDSYAASLAIQPNGDVILHGDEGQQVYYTLQPDGSFTGARGAQSVLSAEGGGYKLVRRDQVVYLFDAQGHLTSEKDRNSQGLTFAYDGQGQLQTITDSVNRQIAITYLNGLVNRVTLPDGRYVEYGYTNGQLTSVRDARGGTTQYTYDAGGRLATIVDQNQHQVVRNVYDPTSGRVTDQYDALNHHSTFAWDPATQTSTFTDARSNQWKDVYSGNLLVKRIDPLQNQTQFAYDSELNLAKVTDARGNATTMVYDAAGNLVSRKAPAPLSYLETWTYNDKNDPLTYKDGRGNTTDYGYDTNGSLTSVTGPDPDGAGPLARPVTTYGRDPGGTGLLTSITDPRGKQTSFTYTNGDLTQIQTQLGNRTTMGYDGSGRMTSLVDPRGYASGNNPAEYTWAYTYNDANQLRTQTDPLANLTELQYDPAGNLLFRKDANLHQTDYAYDDANHLSSVTAPDPDGGGPQPRPITQYAYDNVGNLQTRTDANQHQTVYEYDAANRLTKATAPGNRVWTYGYDGNANVTQLVDANGNATPTTGDGQTTYGYDALNRLTSLDYADTTPDVTFTYDGNGNRTQMTDGAGSETYVYDTLNRLTSVTRGSDAFSYAYDLVNLISATYPGQPAVSYGYDDDERLASAGPSGQTTSYAYDEAGNLKQTTLPSGNGYVETRTYDRAGRLTDVKSAKGATTLSEFAITPDPVGNPLSVVRTGSLAQTQTYAYDNMDRLTSVCFQAGTCPGGSDPFIRWTYDGVGNRLSEARPTGTTSYTYNVADELTQAGSTAYTYDQNGNELSAGSRTFTYDLANRVKATTQGNTTTTYTYDGDGKRLQASTGTQASKKTNFLWDVNRWLPQLALERDGNSSLLRRYTYGQRRISMTSGSNTSYSIHDGLSSVSNLTSATGTTQWTWSYEPFGSIRTEQKASGQQPDNFLKFAGEYMDPTGLYHMRARQYDPVSGRFLTRDPLCRRPGSPAVSGYAYADDLPTKLVDPSGMSPEGSSACGIVRGTTLEGVSIGVASAATDFASGINKGAARADELLPPHIRSIPRVGETFVKRAVPAVAVASAVYEACAYRAQGQSWGSAIGRSAFENGGAVVGATVLPLACLALAPTGVGALACAGGLAIVGGVGGHEVGERIWNWISGD